MKGNRGENGEISVTFIGFYYLNCWLHSGKILDRNEKSPWALKRAVRPISCRCGMRNDQTLKTSEEIGNGSLNLRKISIFWKLVVKPLTYLFHPRKIEWPFRYLRFFSSETQKSNEAWRPFRMFTNLPLSNTYNLHHLWNKNFCWLIMIEIELNVQFPSTSSWESLIILFHLPQIPT